MEDPNLVQLQNSQTVTELYRFLAVFEKQLLVANPDDRLKYSTAAVFQTIFRKLRQFYFMSSQQDEENNNNNNNNNERLREKDDDNDDDDADDKDRSDRVSSDSSVLQEALQMFLGPFLPRYLDSAAFDPSSSEFDEIVSCFIDAAPAAIKYQQERQQNQQPEVRSQIHKDNQMVLANLAVITKSPEGTALFTTIRGISSLIDLLHGVVSHAWNPDYVITSLINVLAENDEAQEILNRVARVYEAKPHDDINVGDLLISTLQLISHRKHDDYDRAEAVLRLIYTYFIRNDNKFSTAQSCELYRLVFDLAAFERFPSTDLQQKKAFAECAAAIINDLGRLPLANFLNGPCTTQIFLLGTLSRQLFEVRAEQLMQQQRAHGPTFDPCTTEALAALLVNITDWDARTPSSKMSRPFSVQDTIRLVVCGLDSTSKAASANPDAFIRSAWLRLSTIENMLTEADPAVAISVVSTFTVPSVARSLSYAVCVYPSQFTRDPASWERMSANIRLLNEKVLRVTGEICLRARDREEAFDVFSSCLLDEIPPHSLERKLLKISTPGELISALDHSDGKFRTLFGSFDSATWFSKRQVAKLLTDKCQQFISSEDWDNAENDNSTTANENGDVPSPLNDFIYRFAVFLCEYPRFFVYRFEELLDVIFFSLLPRSSGAATVAVLELLRDINDDVVKEFSPLPAQPAWLRVFLTTRDEQLASKEFHGFSESLKAKLTDLMLEVSAMPIFGSS